MNLAIKPFNKKPARLIFLATLLVVGGFIVFHNWSRPVIVQSHPEPSNEPLHSENLSGFSERDLGDKLASQETIELSEKRKAEFAAIKEDFRTKIYPSQYGVRDVSQKRLERDQKIKAPMIAAKEGDWELFLDETVHLQTMSDYLLSASISSAIRHNAPLHVFEELISRGARFLPRHTMMLAMKNKVEMVEKLIPLGLSIHVRTASGDNALNALLVTFSARRMFDFLLYNGVEIQNGANIEDPLMKALKGAEINTEAAYYAYKLIQYKAQITTAHIKQFNNLNSINSKSYELLVRNVPELRR
ncbi:hypothetical protein [Alteromonas oceanisediminis]|uniref:hypothetical protein n=1 Tax=Alteromonas oceanisediminis TaxID=2836180 RepID=UPI001BDA6B14|nr:hypothetical protein [Alteromonas oceanisediminis]MBT0585320.1 hypothetical protein [Alteromonas oceanisediminis]